MGRDVRPVIRELIYCSYLLPYEWTDYFEIYTILLSLMRTQLWPDCAIFDHMVQK